MNASINDKQIIAKIRLTRDVNIAVTMFPAGNVAFENVRNIELIITAIFGRTR